MTEQGERRERENLQSIGESSNTPAKIVNNGEERLISINEYLSYQLISSQRTYHMSLNVLRASKFRISGAAEREKERERERERGGRR